MSIPLQSASPSPGFGLSWQMRVVTEICLELGYGVVDGVGGHTECLRDGICLESQDGDISLESELELGKVVGKGVPLHMPLSTPMAPIITMGSSTPTLSSENWSPMEVDAILVLRSMLPPSLMLKRGRPLLLTWSPEVRFHIPLRYHWDLPMGAFMVLRWYVVRDIDPPGLVEGETNKPRMS